MPATVTLATTSLALPLGEKDTLVHLVSGSGVVPGIRLYLDRELLTVVGPAPANASGAVSFVVLRGREGTQSKMHDSSTLVYIGRGDQFYEQDPEGSPLEAIPVSPWINVRNGRVWLAQGDDAPPGACYRWWQVQTVTYSVGSGGVRTMTLSPTVST